MAAVLPVSAQFTGSEVFHVAMVLAAVPITLYVVWSEWSTGGSEWFIVAALSGLALMLISISAPKVALYETELTVCGGVLLAAAHLWRALRAPAYSVEEDV